MWKVVSGFVAGILTLWLVPQLTRQMQDRAAALHKPTHVGQLQDALQSLDETVHENYGWDEGTLALNSEAVQALKEGQVS